MSHTTIRIDGPHGPIDALIARPASNERRPAVLVIQEVFGITPHIASLVERFAGLGYVAVAPDLYTRDDERAALTIDDIETALPLGKPGALEPGLAALPPERRAGVARAAAWRGGLFGRDTYLPDLDATLGWLRAQPDVDPDRVAAIGFCMGGALLGQWLASGVDLRAAAIFYGSPPDLAAVPGVRTPSVQGHYGGTDTPITSKVPDFTAAMRAAGIAFDAFVYDGAPHAFFNDTRASFHPDAARLAWERVSTFFTGTLGVASHA